MKLAALFCALFAAVSIHAATPSGDWKTVAITVNGKAADDEELRNSIWSFALPRLTVADGKGQTTKYSCAVDGDSIELTAEKGPSGWIKFELRGDKLRIAFFDDLQGKPKSFEPSPGSPPLIVLQLVPAH